MKKASISLCALLTIMCASCSKTSTGPSASGSQTINAAVLTNGTYSYVLPSANSYEVLKGPAFSSSSQIQKTGSSTTFVYIASSSYVGTDTAVVVTTTKAGCKGSSSCDTFSFHIVVDTAGIK